MPDKNDSITESSPLHWACPGCRGADYDEPPRPFTPKPWPRDPDRCLWCSRCGMMRKKDDMGDFFRIVPEGHYRELTKLTKAVAEAAKIIRGNTTWREDAQIWMAAQGEEY